MLEEIIVRGIILSFIGLAFILSLYTFRKLKAGLLVKKEVYFLFAYALVLFAFGCSWVEFKSMGRYSIMHCLLIATCCLTPFALTILFKGKQEQQRIIDIFTLIVALLLVFKFFYDKPFFQKLPLNVCNIVSVLIILRPFYRNKPLDNYLLCFGFLGGFFNIILGVDYSKNILHPVYFESIMVHHLYIMIVIYFLITKEIKPDVKIAMKNFYWIIPYFFLMVFLNEIYEFNYFFTSRFENPILGIYEAFPTFGFNIGSQYFEINIIYYLCIIVGAFAVHLILALAFMKARDLLDKIEAKHKPAELL